MKIKIEDDKLLFGEEEYYIHPNGFLSSTNSELAIHLAIERMLDSIDYTRWVTGVNNENEDESDETES